MLDRRHNVLNAKYSGGLQDVAVSYMKLIPSENSSSPPHAHTSPELLPWKEAKVSTTMGVVHFLNTVFVGG